MRAYLISRLIFLLLFVAAPAAAKEKYDYLTGKLLDSKVMSISPEREARVYRVQDGNKLYFVYSLSDRDPLINVVPGSAIQFRLTETQFVYVRFWEGRQRRKNMPTLVTHNAEEFRYDMLNIESAK